MTLPYQRTRSILLTRAFLLRLISPYGGGIKGVKREVREQARSLLRHYPIDFEIDLVVKAIPELLGPIGEITHAGEYTMEDQSTGQVARKSEAGRLMDNKSVSNWIRQARYRASKKQIPSDLTIQDVQTTIKNFNGMCAYCDQSKSCWGNQADALTHAFNLTVDSPNVPANVIPVCKLMKTDNRGDDVASLLSAGIILKSTYLRIIEILLPKRGGDAIREYIKSIMGF